MITVESLQKKYGEINALTNVSFNVEPGSIVGFVGPNGAGKSTTLRIISGLERADHGNSRIDGESSGRVSNPWSKVGTLLDRQGVNGELTGLRALHAVASAYRVPSDQVVSLLDIVDLVHAKDRKVRTFSLGMKQRLNLAIALIAHPKYLILDEPMNGLDPDGIMWLRNFLSSYRDEGGGILLSSHTLSEVEAIADTFVVIQKGATIWTGSKVQLNRSSSSIVAASNQEKLCQILRDHNYEYVLDKNYVHVKDIAPEDLGHLLYREGVIVTHLSEESNSLEKLYLSLRDDLRST